MVNSDGSIVWVAQSPTGTAWYSENNPCPAGWRVPTQTELQSLVGAGSIWVIYNGVTGRLFGNAPNYIFLPAIGNRNSVTGAITFNNNGNYWSSTQSCPDTRWWAAYNLGLNPASGSVWSMDHSFGSLIRCVSKN